ncbi:hypothetical protein CHUAL_010270 [Chamberlinius hualienensis]
MATAPSTTTIIDPYLTHYQHEQSTRKNYACLDTILINRSPVFGQLKMRLKWLAVIRTFFLLIMATLSGNAEPFRSRPDQTDKQMLDQMLLKEHYDKRQRPPGGVTYVNVSVVVLSLASPDESSLKYEVEFLMMQYWRDIRLVHEDDDRHVYLNGIHHQEFIWLPDVYFVKHGDFRKTPLPSNIALRIYKNGDVMYTFRRLLSLSCEGSLSIFPFDDPKCSFAMESISYEADELVYNWIRGPGMQDSPLKFLDSMHKLNAYMIANETGRCEGRLSWRGNYSCLNVLLTFTRDKSFYFSTVFIPGMLLVTSSFITFWLEWNAVPGRVMLGVTTMLNFFTTSNNFRSNLPVVSNLTAMNVWDGVCMCFIYASLLEFVAVNYLGRKKPRALRCYRPTGTFTSVRSPPPSNKGNGDNVNYGGLDVNSPDPIDNGNSGGRPTIAEPQQISLDAQKVPMFDLAHPLRVAKTIDVVSRVVFPVAYGVFLIFFFIRYNGFS